MSVKGESLMPAVHSLEDTIRNADKVTRDSELVTSRKAPATPKSAGKKKVMFLSEWPQNKADLGTHLTFQRLTEVHV